MGHNTKTKKETIWIFKPGEGLLCEGKPGTYTNATANTDTLSLWPKNNTQTQTYVFDTDLSPYLGKGYLIKMVYKPNSTLITNVRLLGGSYSSFYAHSGWYKQLGLPNNLPEELVIYCPLEDCITPIYPNLMVQYTPNGNNNMVIKGLCIL